MKPSSISNSQPTVGTPRLALTPGEPAGIGPDIVLMAAQQEQPAELVAIADPELLRQRGLLLDLPIKLEILQPGALAGPARRHQPGTLKVLPCSLAQAVTPGQLDTANAGYVLDTLQMAVQGCLSGNFDAMVTAPVQKSIINDAGITFTGHTEFLAQATQTARVVMMLATQELRVALATTHLPLAEVPAAINAESLAQTLAILHRDLKQRFGLAAPRIAVLGLNPHAGEGGHMGREEIDIIIPTMERLRAAGMSLIGPLPADTAFNPKVLDNVDAVLAMYHDQGLPVLKYSGFGNAVNITLGLPVIRTSVDHGTALDLAGSGTADRKSLITAIQIAAKMCSSSAELPN